MPIQKGEKKNGTLQFIQLFLAKTILLLSFLCCQLCTYRSSRNANKVILGKSQFCIHQSGPTEMRNSLTERRHNKSGQVFQVQKRLKFILLGMKLPKRHECVIPFCLCLHVNNRNMGSNFLGTVPVHWMHTGDQMFRYSSYRC